MYDVTSIRLVSRTRATLRSAEFGFFGVVVYTRVQTPRFWGAPRSAGVFVFCAGAVRPLRTSWLTVGTLVPRSPRRINDSRRVTTRQQAAGLDGLANRGEDG